MTLPDLNDARENVRGFVESFGTLDVLPQETRSLLMASKSNPIARGTVGPQAKLIQEWLTLWNIRLTIDGQFGPATERAIRTFQQSFGHLKTGRVDFETCLYLLAPQFYPLLHKGDRRSLALTIMDIAQAHLAVHPQEVGGDNRGPWVRLYMDGIDGTHRYWCAGFVCFIIRQACRQRGQSMRDQLFRPSVSCDRLAQHAKDEGRFVTEQAGRERPKNVQAPALFLIRKSTADWTHTGIVTEFDEGSFSTIEGNTNDDGNRNGYEVCKRIRGYKRTDFISLI